MYVRCLYLVYPYSKYYIALLDKSSVIKTYKYIVHTTLYVSKKRSFMARRMKAIIKQIESVVTPSGNSGHVVVPKAWIGKEVVFKMKQEEK
jgi:putative transposon-encoded protein